MYKDVGEAVSFNNKPYSLIIKTYLFHSETGYRKVDVWSIQGRTFNIIRSFMMYSSQCRESSLS